MYIYIYVYIHIHTPFVAFDRMLFHHLSMAVRPTPAP